MSTAETVLRMAVALAAGVTIGLERQLTGRPAGIRTHVLVSIGAAMFTLTGAYGFADIVKGPNVDPARIAAQVASGIGFVGAGAILRDRGGVRGLTTAATVWLTAACGVAAGAGAYREVATGTVFVVVVLVLTRFVRRRLGPPRRGRIQLDVDYLLGAGTLAPILDAVKRAGGRVEGIDLTDEPSSFIRHVSLQLVAPRRTSTDVLAAEVSAINGVNALVLSEE